MGWYYLQNYIDLILDIENKPLFSYIYNLHEWSIVTVSLLSHTLAYT